MKSIRMMSAVALCAVAVAGCTIQNPFGGPSLSLTGSLTADMPGIQAYAASIKAGVKADIGKVQDFFQTVCPLLPQAQTAVSDPTTQQLAVTVTGSDTGGQKLISNLNTGLQVGGKVCATGTSTNWGQALVTTVDAIKAVESLVKTGSI